MKGKIIDIKGGGTYGFIRGEDGERYFYHIADAENQGWRKYDLNIGLELEFEPGRNSKGLNVKKFITKKERNLSTPNDKMSFSKPRLSKAVLLKYIGSDRNFYLFLNKPYHVIEHEKMFSKKSDGKFGFSLSSRFSKENKFKELEEFSFSGIDCAAIIKRQKENIAELYPNNESFEFKPDWRLTLGLGGASVYETDITLHHIYGIPYIPASSIKGVVRSYIIQEAFNNEEAVAILSKEFCDIFGCSKEHEIHKKGQKKNKKEPSYYGQNEPDKADRKGNINFFDAFPINSNDIRVSMDIMNVHYKDYYDSPKNDKGVYVEQEMKPPADWSNPTIINFLTIKKTPFQFLISSKNRPMSKLKLNNQNIVEWTKEALTEHGIGAKTAVGYGYFS